ncbi:NAD(P)H-dependent flavin oxidoreductase [Sphingomonas cavernae]|uniref:Propionate 3-nitronate monooxygenase n=1 Tax=Sphingomonas cavernae TaxID=2320861 RepID=A0A418WQQ2_9SPHN|nr:nitronate monooxygenase [Sphingomonas cavernae]RJF93584.1 nitronate monooxygenase [Sphingomonas cavernae]
MVSIHDLLASRPVIQAPMAGACGVDLAIAAIAGGGIGSLPCALPSPAQVIDQVAAVRAASGGPINLNFFCHRLVENVDETAWHALLAPYYAEYGVGPPASPPPLRRPFDSEMAAVIEQVAPEIVSFHFGLPDNDLLARVRASGALILSSATNVGEAAWLATAGVDAVIAQSFEAGGHIGRFLPAPVGTEMGLFALLPLVQQAVAVPVIAAGGIANEQGVAAALALGADAVQVGTAYLFCPESLATPLHRALLEGKGEGGIGGTRFTNLISGGLARGLPNRLIEELGPVNDVAPPFPYAAAALAELRAAAEAMGRTDFSTLWAGQSAPLGRVEPAEALTRRLVAAARAVRGG